MLRMNIGIEHGNFEYRKKYLKRPVKDEVIINSFNAVAGRNYTTVANSIIGMPDETRDLILDTVELSRKLPKEIDASGAFVWAPYHGSALRDLAVKKGYLDDDTIVEHAITGDSYLDMPSISKAEIGGLASTFSFYVKFPRERFPEIKLAERQDDAGKRIHAQLSQEFDSKYSGTLDPTKTSSEIIMQG